MSVSCSVSEIFSIK